MGDKFPEHIYHSIICIGALVAHQEDDRWAVDALGKSHVGERSEKALIASFVDRIAHAHRAPDDGCGADVGRGATKPEGRRSP
jgi:hypothetical protein